MIKSPLSDSKPDSEKMMGFFRGVVEDNNDPEKAGRVRVRIFGIHTSQLRKTVDEGIPVDELPWAEPCLPIVEGSISGFGMWSVPVQGSHVMLFFEANNLAQPRYFASMPGIPESQFSLEADSDDREDQLQLAGQTEGSGDLSKGFRDPDLVYPTKEKLGEPDVHRLARGVSNGTLVQTKNDNRDLGVPEALGGSWDEPVSPYAAQYPHNLVIATHGGLTVELDSTPGAARLNFYHPSNSYIEIDNEGVMVIKNNDKKYEITLSDNNIHIKRDRNLTIDNDSTKFVKGNDLEETTGNKVVQIDGNVEETIGGNVEETIGGNLTVTVTGNISITSTGPTTVTAPTVMVTSPATTVTGGTVSLAAQGTVRELMNDLTIALYNSHKHWYDPPGGGPRQTDIPIQLLSTAQTTSNTGAS